MGSDTPSLMRAWAATAPRPGMVLTERPVPVPGPGEVLVEVEACGVCRTDLHLTQGDLPPHRPLTTPGHQVVGRVVALGPDGEAATTRTATADHTTGANPATATTHTIAAGHATTTTHTGVADHAGGGPAADPTDHEATAGHTAGGPVAVGERVGVAWLRSTCGRCRYCLRGDENLCPASAYTGWDADGGYAPYVTAPAGYVYRLDDDAPAERLAPLLCAGIIGYRALLRAELPPRGRLGLYGFGASAHLTAQAALAQGHTVHVVTRSAAARELALGLGAASASGDAPPEPLDAAILFAPAGELVPRALEALDRGGTLAVAGIHLSEIPALDYDRHLFEERTLRSVTANTRADGRAYLRLSAEHPPDVRAVPYAFEDAARALDDLAKDQVSGAAVVMIG
ncbi:zinc-binding alcohol dehydrogenase family protein [Nonomuraea longicatena]|uniref:alcohol dehydrogenase n=1 Tax=Nonomuraea longicatena TaxID=83682 RepID=A0ABN1QEK4_9ACTN